MNKKGNVFKRHGLVLLLTIVLVAVFVFGSRYYDAHIAANPGKISDDQLVGTSTGFGGEVKVALTMGDDGKITDVTIVGDNETPEIGGAAIPQLKEQILAAQSADIDGVSGASLTSGAVKAAVAEALGVEAPAAETEKTAESEKAETVSEEAAESEAAPAAAEAASGEGTVSAAGAGFGGDVTVTLTKDADGKITDVAIDAPNETPTIGGAATEELAAQVLAAQSAEIDGVAGATLTTGAVKEAVEKALAADSEAAPAAETEAAADTAAAETEAAEAAAAGETVSAAGTGFGGDVTVTLTKDADGKITDVAIDAPNETPTIGGAATEELAAQVLAAQSAEIDGVAGATLTTGAVKEAVEKALAADSEAAPADDAKSTTFTPGTYTGTSVGFGGEVTATVEVTEDRIESVVLTGDKETVNIGSFAVDMLGDTIVEAQTPKVDTLSGATVTSKALLRAVNDALTQAGADLDAFPSAEKEEIPTEEKTAKELKTQIVIVGAGGAGMTAAIKAVQSGADVLLVEKMPYAGGNTTKATGGMNAAETHYQEEQGIEDSVQQFIDDTMKGGHDINDLELVTKMASESASCIDWLDSIGAPLPKVAFSGGATNARIHAPEDGSGVGAYLVTAFLKQLDELGINVMYNTKATKILMDGEQAVGIVAEDHDTIYTINADAVILATGGFGANNDMIVSYREDLDGTVTTNTPGATGDGIVMGEEVGAALVDIEQIQLHPTVEQGTSMLITESVRGNGAILVNQSGKRFVNEMLTRDAVSAAELEQEGSYAYVIFDQNLRDNLKAIEKYVETGITVQADTIEELAQQINIDPEVLAQTLSDWNKCVAEQKDEEFGRDTAMDADLSVAPYYAIKIAPGIHHTMGGLKINANAEVINTEGNVIPGLYAAGEVTGGVHGGNRIGGNAVADIVVFGNTAGTNAAAYVKGETPAAEAVAETEAAETEAAEIAETENAVKAANENGVITAAEWSAEYPDIVSSMEANGNNTYRISYLEEDPYLTNVYEGYGFAKDYTSAVGHNYCLEDVHNTERPHALANCLTCKTPDFTKMVNDMGEDAYKLDFEETYAQMNESTSCYNCHENQEGDNGKLVVTHSYVTKALGDNVNTIDAATLSCGQCHIEYYFDPETKATSMPYSSVEEMTPEAILAYYDEMGFSDWTQESTGTGLLKAQHPEMETVLQGMHAKMGMNCADCHMAKVENEAGETYTSHEWVSPLASEEILSTCAACHADTDMAEKVHAIQDEVTASEKEVGEKLSAFKDGLAAAVADGKMTEDKLDEVRQLYRAAQWYWDYCYVENSEGAHNSALAKQCLAAASEKIEEGMGLLGA